MKKRGVFFALILIIIFLTNLSNSTIQDYLPDPINPEIDGYILKFSDPPALTYAQNIKSTSALQATAYETTLIEKHTQIKNQIKSNLPNSKIKQEFTKTFNGLSLDITLEEAQSLKNSIPEIVEIYPNYIFHATLYDSIPLINADDVWIVADSSGQLITGKNISVAVIDTGVDYTHTDLGGCLGLGCKVVDGYDFVHDNPDPMDDHGHGTHVAATVAGDGILRGVAPDAQIYAYKVLNSLGAGTQGNIISGIERAVDPNNDGDFSDHLDIISMSLGGLGTPDDPTSVAIDNAVDAGVVAVIAAGNSGPDGNTYCRSGLDPSGNSYSICSPGTARKAITVAASNKFDEIAGFSSRGPVDASEGDLIKPDITAPGVSICAAQWENAWQTSECIDDMHTSISGTSMATPHVAGLVALILQSEPNLTPMEIKTRLQNTAIDIGENVFTQGSGRINAFNSVNTSSNLGLTAILDQIGNANQTINLTGETGGGNYSNHSLYYGIGNFPSSWTLINSSTIPTLGILGELNTLPLEDSVYSIRLEVEGLQGITLTDKKIAIVNNYQTDITSPSGELKSKGTLNITGSTGGVGFTNYRIFYSTKTNPDNWIETEVTLANSGNTPITDGVLGSINTNNLADGAYNLKLSVYSGGIEKETKIKIGAFILDSLLLSGFPKDLGNTVTSLLVEDLDGDNSREIITTTENTHYGSSTQVHVLNELGQELPNWPQAVNSRACVALGNMDDDLQKEIIVSSNENIYVFEKNGSLLPNWPVSFPNHLIYSYTYPCPTIIDIDTDNQDDIIFPYSYHQTLGVEVYGRVVALNRNGQLINGWPYTFWENNQSYLYSTPSVADIDNDGEMEVIQRGYFKNDTIFVLSPNATLKRMIGNGDSPLPTYHGPNSVSIADIDKDGNLDLIDIYNEEIRVYDYDGTPKQGWPQPTDDLCGTTRSSPVISDINNDTFPEIIAGCTGQMLRVFNYTGGLINEYLIYNGTGVWLKNSRHPSPLIADVDNDDLKEIIYAIGGQNKIHTLNLDGSYVSGWPKEFRQFDESTVGPTETPSLEDLDNDGDLDLILGDSYGVLYAWDLSADYDVTKIDWKNFRHDTQHTGLYAFTPQESIPDVVCAPSQTIGDVDGNAIIDNNDLNLLNGIISNEIPQPTNICCIDLNQDNSITISDLLILGDIIAGTSTSPGYCPASLDVNLDGEINIIDVTIITYWQGKNSLDIDWANFKNSDLDADNSISFSDVTELMKNLF